jgi:membrane-associated phospholipid phosphatase
VPGSGIFDSLAVHGSPWNYEHGPVSEISNQFAAMPSLHVAWALWCAAALWVEGRRSRRPTWWFRLAGAAYAGATVITVLATGNHYVLDAVGGAVVLLAGCWIANVVERQRRRRSSAAAATSEAVVAAVDRDDVAGVVAAGAAGEVHSEAAEVVR